MNKIFSHRVTFQIISVVLVILLANSFIQNRNLNRYVCKTVARDLKRAIMELENMNKQISGLYMEGDFEEDYKINLEYIIELDRFPREIDKIFNSPKAAIQWTDLLFMEWTIIDIEKRGYLTEDDEEYLKSLHKYTKRIIQAYYEILEENEIDRSSFNRDYDKIEKVYKEFITETNKIAMEEEYRKITKYRVDKEKAD